MKLIFFLLFLPIQAFTADLLELRYVLPSEKEGATCVKFQDDVLWLDAEVVVSGKHVEKASSVYTENGWDILVKLTDEGGKRFDDLAAKHQGDRLAIISNGKMLSAPTVRKKYYGGAFSISGDFSQEEAFALAKALNDNAAKS